MRLLREHHAAVQAHAAIRVRLKPGDMLRVADQRADQAGRQRLGHRDLRRVDRQRLLDQARVPSEAADRARQGLALRDGQPAVVEIAHAVEVVRVVGGDHRVVIEQIDARAGGEHVRAIVVLDAEAIAGVRRERPGARLELRADRVAQLGERGRRGDHVGRAIGARRRAGDYVGVPIDARREPALEINLARHRRRHHRD